MSSTKAASLRKLNEEANGLLSIAVIGPAEVADANADRSQVSYERYKHMINAAGIIEACCRSKKYRVCFFCGAKVVNPSFVCVSVVPAVTHPTVGTGGPLCKDCVRIYYDPPNSDASCRQKVCDVLRDVWPDARTVTPVNTAGHA